VLEARFLVEGMSCAHCEAAVTKALQAVRGVSRTQVSLETRRAEVRFDPAQTTVAAPARAVGDAGYTLREA